MEGENMKNVYLHCPLLSESDYRNVLDRLCPLSVENVTVYIHADRACAKQLQALVEVQKSFGMERTLRFRNILVFSHVPRFVKSLRRVLVKNNFSVELHVDQAQIPKLVKVDRRLTKSGIRHGFWVDAQEDQWEVCRRFQAVGLPVHLERPRYTADTADRFDRWLRDPSAQGINIFCDIISMLTLEIHSPNCRYASCFGTTFRVDEQLQVYLCPHHMNEQTCLGRLAPRDTLLQQSNVMQLLSQAIEKRGQCTGSCSGFSFCQGGCPLEQDASCTHYLDTVQHIRNALQEVYRSNDLSQVNPIVKNAILNALAFGTAFFSSTT